uniref:Uncharacterized protein n=1 Tax=Populus alba TaxID=43335 RepID=A0A4V6XX24_POPAL|nr:hypothetical protein D5086_0000084240 [Populus alba]
MTSRRQQDTRRAKGPNGTQRKKQSARCEVRGARWVGAGGKGDVSLWPVGVCACVDDIEMILMRLADMNLTFQILMSEMGLQISEQQQLCAVEELKATMRSDDCTILYFVSVFCKIN